MLVSVGHAQDRAANSPHDWQPRIDSLLVDQNLRYAAILNIMREVRYSDSLMTYLQEQARAREHRSAESFAVNSLGVIRRYASVYDEALSFSLGAEKLASEWADTLSIVVARNSRGVVLRRLDRIIEALDAHQSALELATAVSNPDFGTLRAIAISHNSKGQIHLTLDQPVLAEEAFQESLVVERRNDNTLGQAINLSNLASIYSKRNELTRADSAYRAAIALNELIESDLGLAICYTGLAEVLAKRNRLREARYYAMRAIPLAQQRGDDHYTAIAEIQLGRILLQQRNLDQAELHLQQGLDIAEQHGLLDDQVSALFPLAELADVRDEGMKAYGLYKAGHALEREILNEKNQRYVTAVEARYEAAQRAATIDRLALENEQVRERSNRQQRFAAAVIIALLLLAGVLASLYQQRRLKLQRDVAQLEAQRLASQMNPHFLFNALNSIKAQLISADGKEAGRLLDKFARLTRRILTSSIDDEVSLEVELQSSQLYFDIENTRFGNDVVLDIDVHPEINTELISLPPLILQPFLENSLLHGLRPKDGHKRVELSVRPLGEGGFLVSVLDNGVGRKAARAYGAKRPLQQRSVGIDITRRRLEHFARRHGLKFDLVFIDLKAPNGTPLGTEVQLRVG